MCVHYIVTIYTKSIENIGFRISKCPLCPKKLLARHVGPLFLSSDDFKARSSDSSNWIGEENQSVAASTNDLNETTNQTVTNVNDQQIGSNNEFPGNDVLTDDHVGISAISTINALANFPLVAAGQHQNDIPNATNAQSTASIQLFLKDINGDNEKENVDSNGKCIHFINYFLV